jgi:hypothetical protein
MATQKKEIFDKLKIVVSKIIFEREFNPPPHSITGEEFFKRFNDKFNIFESPLIRSGLRSNKNEIIELFDEIYNQNWDEILQFAYAAGKDIKVRTMNVIDFVIDTVAKYPRYSSIKTYWEEYKRENPSGGRRRRFRTKKRKTKKYKRISKRNRKF